MNDRKYLYLSIIILLIAMSIYYYRKNIRKIDTEIRQTDSIAPIQKTAEGIDINTANADMLISLPGIGIATAEKIIQYRTGNGPFDSIEELMNISGIKEKKFSKIKDYIYVSP